MIHKVYKMPINFEREEDWLNRMAAQGLNFISYSPFVFTFRQGTPGEYVYRIELLSHKPWHPESRNYIQFMEETGAELVCTFYRWAYFRRKASDGAFDIFSDYSSRIRHYVKVLRLLLVVGGVNLLAAVLNLSLFFFVSRLPISLYSGLANLGVAIAVSCVGISIFRRMRRLRREKMIYQ